MNLLRNYNLVEAALRYRIKEVIKAKYEFNVTVDGFIATEDGVVASVVYVDSASQFISKDFELRIEDFAC